MAKCGSAKPLQRVCASQPKPSAWSPGTTASWAGPTDQPEADSRILPAPPGRGINRRDPIPTAANIVLSRDRRSTDASSWASAHHHHCRSIACRRLAPAQRALLPARGAVGGFRPCLRCRPESAPGTPAWEEPGGVRRAAPDRAGELDEENVESFSRAPVPAGALRRLVRDAPGRQPGGRRAARTARRPLDESDLRMADIAPPLFRGVRQFNQVMRDFPPPPATAGESAGGLRRSGRAWAIRRSPALDWSAARLPAARDARRRSGGRARLLAHAARGGRHALRLPGQQLRAAGAAPPRAGRPPGGGGARAAAVRSGCGSAGHRPPARAQPGAGSKSPGTPGSSRARRLGRVRAGGARRARPAGERARSHHAGGPAGRPLRRAAAGAG